MDKKTQDLHRIIESFGWEWYDFKKTLNEIDKEVFERLIEYSKKHISSISKYEYLNSPFEPIIMSILVEHEKQIRQIRNEIEIPKKQGLFVFP